jgi:hypothetical protein
MGQRVAGCDDAQQSMALTIHDPTAAFAAGLANSVYPLAKKLASKLPYQVTRPKPFMNFPFIPKSAYRGRKASKAGKRVIRAEKKIEKKVVKAVVKAEKKAMHGVTQTRSGNIPRTKFGFSRAAPKNSKNRPGAVVFKGHEFLGPLTGESAQFAQGTLIKSVIINPLTIGSSRLRTFAGFFEKYRFDDLKIKFVKGCATTVSGSARAAWDMDSGDSLSGIPAQDFISLMSQPGSQSFEFFDDRVFTLPKGGTGTSGDGGFFTNLTAASDPRLVNQAIWNCICENPAQATTGDLPTNLGNFVIYYRCTFWNPVTEGVQLGSDLQAFYSASEVTALPWSTQDPQTGGNLVQKTDDGTSVTTFKWSGQVQSMSVFLQGSYNATATWAIVITNARNLTDPNSIVYRNYDLTTTESPYLYEVLTPVDPTHPVSMAVTVTGGTSLNFAQAVFVGSTLPLVSRNIGRAGEERRLRNLLEQMQQLARSIGVSERHVPQLKPLLLESKEEKRADTPTVVVDDFHVIDVKPSAQKSTLVVTQPKVLSLKGISKG